MVSELTLDHPERIEVRRGPSVDAEDLLSVPDHSGQVARQHHLQENTNVALYTVYVCECF